VHLAACGNPVVGDELYGKSERAPTAQRRGTRATTNLGLRAIALAYFDPFVRRRVEIRAPMETFVREYGFELPKI
jgi:23S rRNA-/tRNA-specific pseudouridylate synthase